MLTSILGDLGAGKTLLTIMASYYSKLPIVSNFKVEIPNRECIEFDTHKFLKAEYENCIVIIDEAYNYLEARVSSRELNRQMSYILFQSRKKNVDIYITAQLFSTIDLRFRQLSDIIIYALRPNIPFCDFTYFIQNKLKVKKIRIKYEKAIPFFSYYDTNQVVFERDEKLDFTLKNGNQKEIQIEEYANEIMDYYEFDKGNKITSNMVKLYFTTHDLPKFLINEVYTVISLKKKEDNPIPIKKSRKRTKKRTKS